MTPASPNTLRIAVADDEGDMRQFFEEVLTHLGHKVVVNAETGRQLIERCRTTPPDLIITDIRMPDMDGLEAAAAVNRERPVPIVAVSAHSEKELLDRASAGPVMTYLIKPIKPTDLQAAIMLAVARFEQFRKVSQEAASLRQALEDRKVIERAKEIVARRLRLEEAMAFRRLQKLASVRNHKLAEVAQRILEADRVFQELENVPGPRME
jgi:AmiR/NasT family two-component response regulator